MNGVSKLLYIGWCSCWEDLINVGSGGNFGYWAGCVVIVSRLCCTTLFGTQQFEVPCTLTSWINVADILHCVVVRGGYSISIIRYLVSGNQ